MTKMFCNQCEQTAKGTGCTVCGVCSKEPLAANTMDAMIYALRQNALVALEARSVGIIDSKYDMLSANCLFTTLTNVNFDEHVLKDYLHKIITARKSLLLQIAEKKGKKAEKSDLDIEDFEGFVDKNLNGHRPNQLNENIDIQSLMQTTLFGLKGLCAYISHANMLDKTNTDIMTFIHEALSYGYDNKQRTLEEWIQIVKDVGKWNFETMKLLDEANCTLGNPTPTKVLIGHKKGKCVLVSGHDLFDMKKILEQTENTDVLVYSHGEMLPAHGYPELHKYKNFVGHFGTAWFNQQTELLHFPGPVVFTSNCIMKPKADYIDHIYTTNEVGFKGVKHIGENKDFSGVIQKANEMKGFEDDEELDFFLTGFGHHSILETEVAGKIVNLVKEKKVTDIFVIGGCDGMKKERNYYTEIIKKLPPSSLVITCGCGKYRFYREKLGEIEGIPRLIDVGQCNDTYTAFVVAIKLAEIFKCGVNELPLHIILSWYEQKAVCILLTVIYLGLKNVRIGPSPPAYLSPNVFKYLADNLGLKMITTVDNDLANL
ncbi:hydroxylamine reductase, putative [Entamoeba invadens IP1]|uniref:Hydroxylamine reductase, putative n=3 Tax=Entamoeba invadens TaxID=33085 RepID=A0A0A1UB37_ENTIV|nr:hydroxylamine reductase, putative [Entamoeba invadens IP1]ELP92417.1 hydroxylamine reductase, putative [Entamoeba invadens IP1]BAN41145.1 hydroxylamine reductase, putative [Entamoeba invadens]|eukprot:XP_004259188.1 hydroxylamine reductase, putative [Entamoeba invadens IP1]